MKNNSCSLTSIDLFKGIESSELEQLLACLSAQKKRYEKGQVVFFSGESISRFGIVLSGQIQVVQDDFYGNRSIVANVDVGNLFGESFAYAEMGALPVSVLAVADSELLLIDCRRLTAPCARSCAFHGKLIRNLLHIVSAKNIALTQKIEVISKRTTREKLLAYLSSEAKKAGGSRFQVPFSRQELADYLCVDRSAMSAELSKLKAGGILNVHKNQFELL